MLVDDEGNYDLENGHPNKFSFEDPYHSLVFVLLTVFDEEWDVLMFQEYLGVKPRMLIVQLVVMVVGHLILPKYLAAALTS